MLAALAPEVMVGEFHEAGGVEAGGFPPALEQHQPRGHVRLELVERGFDALAAGGGGHGVRQVDGGDGRLYQIADPCAVFGVDAQAGQAVVLEHPRHAPEDVVAGVGVVLAGDDGEAEEAAAAHVEKGDELGAAHAPAPAGRGAFGGSSQAGRRGC